MSNNKFKVLVVQGLHEKGLEMLESRSDIEYKILLSDDENEIMKEAVEADAITVRTANITKKIINSAKNLKVVSRHGVGYDSIDVVSLTEKKVPLTIAVNSNMISVAEHSMMMILGLAKNVFYYDQFTKKADWSKRWDNKAWDIAQKKLLIIGFGRIGSRVAKRAIAFDMNTCVYDPYINDSIIIKAGANVVKNIKDILPTIDFVTIHCPKNDETENMFSMSEFNVMKRSSFIINCARGGIINEIDLYKVLKEGKIAGAGLDVFEKEPTPKSNKLLELENVILSPHIAGVTFEATIRMSTECVQNVLNIFDDKLDKNVIVNKEIFS